MATIRSGRELVAVERVNADRQLEPRGGGAVGARSSAIRSSRRLARASSTSRNGVVPRAAVVTGGNPDLLTDRRRHLQAERATGSRSTRSICGCVQIMRMCGSIGRSRASPFRRSSRRRFPSGSSAMPPAICVSVDLRPVNFDNARRDTLRFGFDFTKPLSRRRRLRRSFRRLLGRAQSAGIAVPTGLGSRSPELASPAAPANGRLTFSLTDTITFVDKVTIRPGLPELDYLHGAPIGQTGGQPRHQVQAQAGWSNNGLGARIGANWRSGTEVNTLTGDTLHFSPLGDLRSAAVRQSRRHSRARAQASVAARQLRSGSRSTTSSTPGPRCTTRPATCRSTISPTCSIRSAGRS